MTIVVISELSFDKTFLTGTAWKKRACVSVKWNSSKTGGCLMKTGKCLKQKMCQKRSNEYDLSAAPYLFPFFYSTSGLAQALKSQSELSKMLEARASRIPNFIIWLGKQFVHNRDADEARSPEKNVLFGGRNDPHLGSHSDVVAARTRAETKNTVRLKDSFNTIAGWKVDIHTCV